MNFGFVIRQFGLLLIVLSTSLLLLSGAFFLTEFVRQSEVAPNALKAILASALLGAAIGGGLWLLTRRAKRVLGRRDALLLVAITWLLGAAFAAVPYYLWAIFQFGPGGEHIFNGYVDCYFEAMSGLTTTGATVLGDRYPIAELPRSLLLWRAFTQWIGGLGIVVVFIALLPILGVGGKRLFKLEAHGTSPDRLQPQIRQTARVLLYIYVAFTAVEALALMVAGLSFFQAVCHAFTTIATAGFSTSDAGVGGIDSTAVDVILVVFMFLGGVNFALYYALFRRRYTTVLRDPELRTYLVVLAASCTVISIALIGWGFDTTTGQEIESATVGEAIRHGIFNTISIGTTTGYATANTDQWPFVAKAVLVALMFMGGSAGSTAGGIKVIRIWLAFKILLSEIEHIFRPQVIRPVRVGADIVHNELMQGTLAYILGIVVLFAAGSVAVMLLEQFSGSGVCDYATAAAASLACVCTIGPGMARVGAIENYGWLTSESKLVLSILMALGRLEIFAIIVLFTPRFWRGD